VRNVYHVENEGWVLAESIDEAYSIAKEHAFLAGHEIDYVSIAQCEPSEKLTYGFHCGGKITLTMEQWAELYEGESRLIASENW